MDMINTTVLVSETDTKGDVINKICQQLVSDPDEPICFSAIYNRQNRRLILNITEDNVYNTFSAKDVIKLLNVSRDKKVMFVQPAIESYIIVFRPMLEALSCKYADMYHKSKEEILSELYMTIIDLRHKGYYLSKNLLASALQNRLRTDYSRDANNKLISLDAVITDKVDNKCLHLSDVLTNENELIDLEAAEFRRELYDAVSKVMIEELGEFMFRRVLYQINTNTIDTFTSRVLLKYRQRFNKTDNYRIRKTLDNTNNTDRMRIKLLEVENAVQE